MYWVQPSVTTSPGTPVKVYGVVQLSVNVVVGASGHSALHPSSTMSSIAIITGGVSSTTYMVWLQLALRPQKFVTIHVRVTLYSSGQSPYVVSSEKVTVGFESAGSEISGLSKLGV